jgi:ubiquinone/menaquinone biosynthesis C-methylase UbiE
MGFFVGQKHARSWFEFLSSNYNFINPFVYTSKMKNKLLSELKDGLVLDVGVGTGYTTKELKNAVGLDITWKMLRQAKANYKGNLVLGDAVNPPFKEDTFSNIISAGSLYYLPDTEKALLGLYRLLKEDGVLLTLTPSLKILKPLFYIFSKTDLKKLFEKSGFFLEKIESIRWYATLSKGLKKTRGR